MSGFLLRLLFGGTRRDPDGWFQTYSGRRVWPLDVRAEDLCSEDVAHALSLICRFGGHSRFHYSVGQHSLLVSRLVPPELALEGLLHDASEAYLGDVVRPMKHAGSMWGYRRAEKRLERTIAGKWGLRFPFPPAIKHADRVALRTEKRDVLRESNHAWADFRRAGNVEPTVETIVRMAPEDVEHLFLARFRELLEQREVSRAA